MKKLELSLYDYAKNYLGEGIEIPGVKHNPLILAMLQLDNPWFDSDETAWCSACLNWWCHRLKLSRSKSPAARSWLLVGDEIKPFFHAEIGFDIVVLKRGNEPQPDATVIDAQGHVGVFGGFWNDRVNVLAGNQGNKISIESFPNEKILGIRRLYG